MIRIKLIDGLDCPMIMCDYCGEIVRGGLGMIAFDRDGVVRFLHKRTCDRDRNLLWMELSEFLEHLLVNTSDPEKESRPEPRPSPTPRATTPKPIRRSISLRRRLAILQRDQFRCQLCGRGAEIDGVALHVDHQQPLSKGGTNEDENLWTLCADCNLGKGDQT